MLFTSWQALIHGLGRHYYSMPINYRKNELEQKVHVYCRSHNYVCCECEIHIHVHCVVVQVRYLHVHVHVSGSAFGSDYVYLSRLCCYGMVGMGGVCNYIKAFGPAPFPHQREKKRSILKAYWDNIHYSMILEPDYTDTCMGTQI